jgi:hypothetical protein
MKELDLIDPPDGRHGMVVCFYSDHRMIIVEVGSELIDHIIKEKPFDGDRTHHRWAGGSREPFDRGHEGG